MNCRISRTIPGTYVCSISKPSRIIVRWAMAEGSPVNSCMSRTSTPNLPRLGSTARIAIFTRRRSSTASPSKEACRFFNESANSKRSRPKQLYMNSSRRDSCSARSSMRATSIRSSYDRTSANACRFVVSSRSSVIWRSLIPHRIWSLSFPMERSLPHCCQAESLTYYYAIISRITCPKSISNRLRPGISSRCASRPSWCKMVACRSVT